MPTLLEFVLILGFIAVCYGGAAYLFIRTFGNVDVVPVG